MADHGGAAVGAVDEGVLDALSALDDALRDHSRPPEIYAGEDFGRIEFLLFRYPYWGQSAVTRELLMDPHFIEFGLPDWVAEFERHWTRGS